MSRKIALFLTVVSLSASAWALDNRPLEPIDLPPSVEQGVDMVYIDQELAPRGYRPGEMIHEAAFGGPDAAPLDLLGPANPLYTELRRGLVRYQMRWGGLPQIEIPTGPVLKPGIEGERVALLRERLGLTPGTKYDAELARVVTQYQDTHGLKADGIAGAGTVASLNLGSEHYERILLINLERAKRLPVPGAQERYVLVDAGSAKLTMFERDRPVDSMKVGVGTAETATPMMAGYIRFAALNPYWNVPPELVNKIVAPAVVREGLVYLTDRKYEILSDWTEDAKPVDPNSVDWKALAAGQPTGFRFRRGPGPWNSMGKVKFMLPNDFGIYLHDYPDKTLFDKDDRWVSNGCIRLDDTDRFARFLYGYVPTANPDDVEKRVDLPRLVPVYMTYLTAEATPDGVRFLPDRYGRDQAVLARYFGGDRIASATR